MKICISKIYIDILRFLNLPNGFFKILFDFYSISHSIFSCNLHIALSILLDKFLMKKYLFVETKLSEKIIPLVALKIMLNYSSSTHNGN